MNISAVGGYLLRVTFYTFFVCMGFLLKWEWWLHKVKCYLVDHHFVALENGCHDMSQLMLLHQGPLVLMYF